MRNFFKKILRLFLTEERRTSIAVRLLGDKYHLLKKSAAAKEKPSFEGLVTTAPTERSIQNILSLLPHVMPGYLTTDWFWSETYYPYYVNLAKLLKPRSILEIGSLQGFSLISMAEGCANIKSLTWIDSEMYLPSSNQMCYENVQYFFKNFRTSSKIPQMRFFTNSWDALSLKGKIEVDLIHIDGEHTYEGKLRDLAACSLLQPRYIILDDYFNTMNHQAIDYWAKHNRLNFFVIDTFNRGLAVFDFNQKKKALTLVKESGLPIAKVFNWKEADTP